MKSKHFTLFVAKDWNIMKLINKQTKERSHHVTPLAQESFPAIKRAFSTRNVPESAIQTLLTGDLAPKAGDLVLARVDRLRQHLRIELPNGRYSRLFVGDHIIVCYGNRYAADQFESLVPDSLAPCHLVAGGGIASAMRFRHPKVKRPTEISPLGLIGDSTGKPLNLIDWKPDPGPQNKRYLPTFLVVGSSMNSGKTTTAARLINVLNQDGYRTGAIKVTGTGSGCDLWRFRDAGASHALDFTDAGHASTYRLDDKAVLGIVNQLGDAMRNQDIDVIVMEVADGLLQDETRALLANSDFRDQVDGAFFNAVDSHSALHGVECLQNLAYNVVAVSGVVSSNPLARQEFQSNCAVPVVTKKEISQPGFGIDLMERLATNAPEKVMQA